MSADGALSAVGNLKRYREKRHFNITSEPAGRSTRTEKEPIFVVQKHEARRLHYDLRLEVGGVLKSWAVPKEPSIDPDIKRLAVAVEDHPMEYADFEGTIAAGEYGAGRVTIWDRGIYVNITQKGGLNIDADSAIRHGHLVVRFFGKKLKGNFSLSRFRSGPREQWLLSKGKEQLHPVVEQAARTADLHVGSSGVAEPMPKHLPPMYAVLSNMPSNASEYSFEYKWDGIRLLTYIENGNILLESRNRLDVTFRWPELYELAGVFRNKSVILDGELVAGDSRGGTSFQALSRRMHVAERPSPALMNEVPVVYMIFDLLYYDNYSLSALPYFRRRQLLESLNLNGPSWRTPPAHVGRGEDMIRAAGENQLEGVVAKKIDSLYLSGKRSDQWLKIKIRNRSEFVIGGWIPEKNEPERGVGAVLAGYYDQKRILHFAGKVGTGFDSALRMDLKERFDAIQTRNNPFSENITDKSVIFVEPELVAEIEFREWTRRGRLRHPSFKGLRTDKMPLDVRKEESANHPDL